MNINILKNIINDIGEYGPFILFFISLILLWSKESLFFYYIIGFFINIILNIFLKIVFEQPRPSVDIKLFESLKKTRILNNKNIILLDMFGMPSGHTQMCFFSLTFIFLSLKKYNILFGYLLISILTMYQRVNNNYHTLLQIFFGAIFGCLLGYIMYYISKKNIKGRIKAKPDDDSKDSF